MNSLEFTSGGTLPCSLNGLDLTCTYDEDTEAFDENLWSLTLDDTKIISETNPKYYNTYLQGFYGFEAADVKLELVNEIKTIETGWDCSIVKETEICVPIHSDGKVVGDEECDDGNTNSYDGCNNSGRILCGWKCPYAGQRCIKETCGNGKLDRFEICDSTLGCKYDCTY